jgi:hypothetical protein
MSQRIDEQEALLERLTRQRDELSEAKLPKKPARNDMNSRSGR